MKKDKELKNKKNKTAEERTKFKALKKNKELLVIFLVMLASFIIFFISYSIFQSLRTFEYQGLTFTKVKFGEIPFYRYYYYTDIGATGRVVNPEQLHQINLYLRVDPRENNVPVEGEILFPNRKQFLYVSVNATNLNKCEYTNTMLASLTIFLSGNQFNVRGATPDEKVAEEANFKHITCENRQDNMVILIQEGTETKIVREADKCYVISVANCDAIEAIEKFMTQSIIDAKTRA